MRLRHVCEWCGVEDVLTPEKAAELGWDYPPTIGRFAVLGPRLCPAPACEMTRSVWWALQTGLTVDELTAKQWEVINRIRGEPASIRVDDE